MERRIINPWNWQEPLGIVWINEVPSGQRTLYLSGHGSLDDKGQLLHPGDMRAQIHQTFDNIEVMLRAAGASMANVVRLNYYTTDVESIMSHWASITERLKRVECQPASTLVGVTSLAIRGMLIEIEATAVV
jgi:enamine deaminase RidA (YjgF/YER057c/UK114 family)